MDWAGYIGGYMYIHMYMHIYVQAINEQRRHDFEGLFGGVYGKFSGMKGKGKCNYSVISKIERNNFCLVTLKIKVILQLIRVLK